MTASKGELDATISPFAFGEFGVVSGSGWETQPDPDTNKIYGYI